MSNYAKMGATAVLAAAVIAASGDSFAGSHPLLPPLAATGYHSEQQAVWPWPIEEANPHFSIRAKPIQEAKIRITITIG